MNARVSQVRKSEALPGLLARLRALSAGLRRSRIVAVLVLAAFMGGLILAVRSQPDLLTTLDWRPLPALLALYGLSVVLGGLETRQLAMMLGGQMNHMTGLRLCIVGSISNMLPIPGAAMVRVAGLKASGVSLTRSAASTLAVAVLWLGLSVLAAGTCLIFVNAVAGLALLIAGMIAGGASAILLQRLHAPRRGVMTLVFCRVGFVVIETGAFVMALLMLGVDAGLVESLLLAVSGVVASVIGFAPAGLGVREGLAAGLATLVSLPVATGFLAATVTRLASSLIAFLAALPFLFTRGQPVLSPSSVSTISRDG